MPIRVVDVRASRAYLAGFGTAGSLLAGVAMLFVLASALVSFNGWPQVADQSQSVSVVRARPVLSTATVRRVATSTRRVTQGHLTAPSRRVASVTPRRPDRVLRDNVRTVIPAAPVAHVHHTRPPATVRPSSPPASPPAKCLTCTVRTLTGTLGAVTQGTTAGLGTAVSGAGQALGGAASGATAGLGKVVSTISPALGSVVTGAGQLLGATTDAATAALGQTLNGAGKLLGGLLSGSGSSPASG
jgi:hypothetical protein